MQNDVNLLLPKDWSQDLAVKIDTDLLNLGFHDLHTVADYFDKQVDIKRARAFRSEYAATLQDRLHIREKFLSGDIPKMVYKQLRRGMGEKRAFEEVATIAGIPARTVEVRWINYCKARKKRALRDRNTKIYELAVLGHSNDEIGKRFNLHPNSVSRIISQEKKKSSRPVNAHPARYEVRKRRYSKPENIISFPNERKRQDRV